MLHQLMWLRRGLRTQIRSLERKGKLCLKNEENMGSSIGSKALRAVNISVYKVQSMKRLQASISNIS